MIPAMCLKNDDCVRACVATIMEMETKQVPHFYENPDGDAAFTDMREWLIPHGRIPAYFTFDGEMLLSDALTYIGERYPRIPYMLFCHTSAGDHCVVGYGESIEHDPAWIRRQITGPHSSGYWIAIILARL